MKKVVFLLLLFIFSIPNLFASTYSSWSHESVTSLPTADSSTLNKIYDYNNKYYITSEVQGGLRNLQSGDNINSFYLDFGYDFSSHTNEEIFNYFFNSFTESGLSFTLGSTSSYSLISIYYSRTTGNSSASVFKTVNCNSTFDSYIFNSYKWIYPDRWFFLNNSVDNLVTCDSYFTIGNNIDITSILYPYIYIYSDSTYSWIEISYYDWYEFNDIIDSDFYLFYSFNDISSFNILSWVDFSTFSDFQKLVIVLGFNILFLGIIGLFIYLILKTINKLISMLF